MVRGGEQERIFFTVSPLPDRIRLRLIQICGSKAATARCSLSSTAHPETDHVTLRIIRPGRGDVQKATERIVTGCRQAAAVGDAGDAGAAGDAGDAGDAGADAANVPCSSSVRETRRWLRGSPLAYAARAQSSDGHFLSFSRPCSRGSYHPMSTAVPYRSSAPDRCRHR